MNRPPRYKIVGTAGHIDHGKSALVRALTGTDPDRLQEERERGITIDLGFAHFALPDGTRVGFIDVPGHERFVKNMLAGIGGIDAVLLVVAADESIMPQTREHLAICRLLGIDKAVVAITKCDLVDEEIAELVRLEVRDLLADTPLRDAAVVSTSATTGAGFDELRSALVEVLEADSARPASPFARLPIDRVFTLRGFGTVVTGTLLSGRIAAGDRLELLPAAMAVNVRGVQVYNEPVDAAVPGQRTAVNLQGVEVEAVTRGDLLVTPGCLAPGYLLDVHVDMLPEHGLEQLQRVRFHHGAAEILCRVVLLEPGDIAAGGSGLAQLRLEAPYACAPGDRFVLRRYSPMITIGGGLVVDNAPAKHRRGNRAARARLLRLRDGSPAERLATLVDAAGDAAAHEQALCRRLFIDPDRLDRLAGELATAGRVLRAQQRPLVLLDGARAAALADTLLDTLRAHHRQNPLAPAAPKSALAAALPRDLPAAALDALVRHLAGLGKVRESADGVALTDHSVTLSPQQEEARAALLRRYDEAGWAPPATGEALAGLGVDAATADQVFHLLLRQGELVRLRDDLVLHRHRLQALVDELRRRHAAGATFSVAEFKEWTGVSRKHAIPLLEHLDQQRVTRREGDLRVRI